MLRLGIFASRRGGYGIHPYIRLWVWEFSQVYKVANALGECTGDPGTNFCYEDALPQPYGGHNHGDGNADDQLRTGGEHGQDGIAHAL